MLNESINVCPCVVGKKVFLYYPYYANTFLLNYSIMAEGLLGDEANSDIIKWDKETLIDTLIKEKDSDKDILIFFATKRMLDDKSFPSDNIDKFDFSLYQPRFVFIPFSIEAYRSCYSGKNFESEYSSLIEGFKKDLSDIPSINDENIKAYIKHYKLSESIFSDTPEEASEIVKILKSLNYFSENDNSPELKLLYYGAPYTIYLFNKYPEFLPIRIDFLDLINNQELNNYFDTKIVLYCKLKDSCEYNGNCCVKNKIENFHRNIFDKAKENPKSLADIYSSFIQENKEQIPNQIFQNVECFSKAITYHHNYPTKSVDSKIKTFASDLRHLPSNDYGLDYRAYEQSRKSFKENSLAYYTLLIFHYILNNERSLEKMSFKEIATSLRDKAFLNGKYILLFRSVIRTLYAKFLNEIDGIKNPISEFCSDHDLNIASKIIYYQFTDDIVVEVTKKTKEINLSDAFNYLIIALSDVLNKDNISSLESEIEHTVLEISDIKGFVFEKYIDSILFNSGQKKKILKIHKQSIKENTESSFPSPDIKKIAL